MTLGRRLLTLGAGLLAGALATLVMALLFVAGRTWLGVSPPPEAIPDRFAPTLSIDAFFSLFGRYGGYDGLKKFGIRSGVQGLLAVGLLVGVIYAFITELGAARSARPWRWGASPIGRIFLVAATAVLRVATVIVLWPVLDATYRGLPPGDARIVTAAWLLIAYTAYALTLMAAYGFMLHRAVPLTSDAPVTVGQPVARRAVVVGLVAILVAGPTVALFRRLWDRATFSYDGLTYSGPDIEPIAPNDRFYSVTKNVVDPVVSTNFWGLEIGGHVDRSRTYDFDQFKALPAIDQESTLMCISNRIGSGLFSNANWRGVPMRDLLEEAGVRDGAVEVLLHAADGFTDTFSIEKALEPTTLIVFEMNGEPLPQRHGFPARVIVPGLYGEKNVKWITGIEVVDHDAKGFYEQQGWGPNFVVPTRSDIFAPRWGRTQGDRFEGEFRVGQEVRIRGRAFAGNRGIQLVEASANDGETWGDTQIDYAGTDLTWTFWSFRWRPTAPGEYVITSRATDGEGELQTDKSRGIVPQGAAGRHRVIATVV